MKYHMFDLCNKNGHVSPLCAPDDKPRKIRLDRNESWTLLAEAVTCKKCLAKMECIGGKFPRERGNILA